ncbi:hypothetical protein D1N53_22730 [Clostridioides difficile]|nr:hypothetical protein D1N53_22730 [Clostridioides difficile]
MATNIYNNLTEVSYALLPTTRVRFKKIAKLIPFETTSQDFPRFTPYMKLSLHTAFHHIQIDS